VHANLDRVSQRTDSFDLGRLSLSSGQGRRLELHTALGDFELSGERYAVEPAISELQLDISRMTGGGYALRLRFEARLVGPCMRCLEHAALQVSVDAREIEQPGEAEELDSPYVSEQILDVSGWAHDALSLALPAQVLCRAGCAGLCAVCGANLNDDPEHAHEPEPDPRWAKLKELKLE
jgi:uncharacterized protein